ncbi:circadian clock KaiB family protein [Candidatus Villigracilis saccharophilus]|uniref:circadian clock KaiB family protein n=1 Tax=Candidatus Villigracilis saccharophilus TaxID=3140684 RepID=UPI0031ED5331
MKTESPSASTENSANKEKWILRLYIAGMTPNSKRAIANLNKICAENLQGQYILEVIDLIENLISRRGEQIIAVPVLIKKCLFHYGG